LLKFAKDRLLAWLRSLQRPQLDWRGQMRDGKGGREGEEGKREGRKGKKGTANPLNI